MADVQYVGYAGCLFSIMTLNIMIGGVVTDNTKQAVHTFYNALHTNEVVRAEVSGPTSANALERRAFHYQNILFNNT